ncbi:MAG TPA: acyltransferase [Clostridia bacterium]|nr:acyltransferase [Clostridia bacterium]
MATLTAPWTEAAAERVSARSLARFYHPELDILRFFAFLLVFLHHAMPHDPAFYVAMGVPGAIASVLAGAAATGAFGVDVFFTLSSYLITELLLREKENFGAVDVKAFYARRILRIWPLYFAFLGIAVALQWVVPGQKVGWGTGLAFSLLAGNWWIVFKGFPSSIIFPLWSVSIEEQFYLAWPAVVKRIGERGLVIASGVLLVVATATRFYLGAQHAGESQVWCNTFARLDPIALGILLAVFLGGSAPQLSLMTRTSLGTGGLACLALAANYFVIKGDPLATSSMVFGYPTVALGSAALLLSVLSARAALNKSALVYLGRISYGLYVFHVLGLMISDSLVSSWGSTFPRFAAHAAIAFVATVAMAAVSFHWLETPFLNLKQRFTHVLSRPGG